VVPEAEGRRQSEGLGEMLSMDVWGTKLAGSPGELSLQYLELS